MCLETMTGTKIPVKRSGYACEERILSLDFKELKVNGQTDEVTRTRKQLTADVTRSFSSTRQQDGVPCQRVDERKLISDLE